MRRVICIFSLFCILFASVALSFCIGENGLRLSQLFSLSDIPSDGAEYIILTQLRLPRTVIALAVGALLGASGIIMQSVFRNPLVEPYTLGISGGALLGVSLCIALGLSSLCGENSVALFAVLGSVLAMLIVNPIRNSSMPFTGSQPNRLLLSGIMFSFVASALTTLLLSLSTREQLSSIVSWSIGSFSGVSNWSVTLCSIVSLAFFAISPFLGNILNILLLGKVESHSLGIRTDIWIPALLFIASVLAAVSVASAGIIAFVGMVVPHFSRSLFGHDCRLALPAGMLLGACIMLLCDILAREIIYPQELPVGVISGLMGGVIFIWINYRNSK